MYPPQQPPHLNVPLPDPSAIAPQQAQQPDRIQQAMSLIAPMFAMGTALGGSPRAGLALLSGVHQTQEKRRKEDELRQHQQQQLQMQQAQLASLDAHRQALEEAQRQQAIQKLVESTYASVQGKSKGDYESAIGFAENIGQQFYGLAPNKIRAMVPYRAPDAGKNLYAALDKYFKNPANKNAIDSGAVMQAAISVDTDGDGVPDRPVPIGEAIKLSGYPVFIDPETQKPIDIGKPVKPENVQDFDLVYQGLVDKWKADKGRVPTDTERGQLALQARRQLKDASTPPTAAGVLPPKMQTQVNTVSNAFRSEPIVKKTNTVAEAVSFVNSLDPKSQNPADDQALIYAFAKAMDPDSVVREGEYATVQKYSQSWLDSFGFNAQRIVANKEFLTPEARANLKATVLKKFRVAKGQYDNVRKGFARQIRAATGGQADPDDYLLDYAAAFPNPETGEPAPRTGQGVIAVKAPNGKTYHFATQDQADKFKSAAGIQ
jgi:hypothetical protein